MNKKEENNDNLKKPEPFAYKNWTELIKPVKIDVDKKEEQKAKGEGIIEEMIPRKSLSPKKKLSEISLIIFNLRSSISELTISAATKGFPLENNKAVSILDLLSV